MSAWLRFGWVVVAVGVVGSGPQSGAYARGYDTWGWTGWNVLKSPAPTVTTPSPVAHTTPVSVPATPAYSGSLPTFFPTATATPVVSSAAPYFTPLAPSPAAVPGGPVYILPSWFTPASTDPNATVNSLTQITPPNATVTPATTDTAPVTPAAQVLPITPTTTPAVNAFINLGSGSFKDADTITSGGTSAWSASTSPQVLSLFGGPPTAQQQADFTSTVMHRVEQSFALSNVPVSITTNPSVPAAHTLSLVSNTSAQLLPAAIGMTYVGGNGFSFLDQQAQAAQSLDQLEWITAHNIAHELMLALGVHEKYDSTGKYLDARNALWNMMTNPDSTFSPDAVKALNLALAQPSNTSTADPELGAQALASHPVPEPAAVALWVLGGLAVAFRRRLRFAA